GSALDSPPKPKNLTTDVPEGLLKVFKLLLRPTLLPSPSQVLDRVTAVEVQVLRDVDDLSSVGPAIGVVRGVIDYITRRALFNLGGRRRQSVVDVLEFQLRGIKAVGVCTTIATNRDLILGLVRDSNDFTPLGQVSGLDRVVVLHDHHAVSNLELAHASTFRSSKNWKYSGSLITPSSSSRRTPSLSSKTADTTPVLPSVSSRATDTT